MKKAKILKYTYKGRIGQKYKYSLTLDTETKECLMFLDTERELKEEQIISYNCEDKGLFIKIWGVTVIEFKENKTDNENKSTSVEQLYYNYNRICLIFAKFKIDLIIEQKRLHEFKIFLCEFCEESGYINNSLILIELFIIFHSSNFHYDDYNLINSFNDFSVHQFKQFNNK